MAVFISCELVSVWNRRVSVCDAVYRTCYVEERGVRPNTNQSVLVATPLCFAWNGCDLHLLSVCLYVYSKKWKNISCESSSIYEPAFCLRNRPIYSSRRPHREPSVLWCHIRTSMKETYLPEKKIDPSPRDDALDCFVRSYLYCLLWLLCGRYVCIRCELHNIRVTEKSPPWLLHSPLSSSFELSGRLRGAVLLCPETLSIYRIIELFY